MITLLKLLLLVTLVINPVLKNPCLNNELSQYYQFSMGASVPDITNTILEDHGKNFQYSFWPPKIYYTGKLTSGEGFKCSYKFHNGGLIGTAVEVDIQGYFGSDKFMAVICGANLVDSIIREYGEPSFFIAQPLSGTRLNTENQRLLYYKVVDGLVKFKWYWVDESNNTLTSYVVKNSGDRIVIALEIEKLNKTTKKESAWITRN